MKLLASAQQIQSIPSQPFTVKVLSPVNIAVKPGSSPATINTTSQGNIPVAILSTSTFNAPSTVDLASLTFGRIGDEQSLSLCNSHGEDVNGDGLPDLVCHFSTQKAGFARTDVQGVLTGRTVDGVPFRGTDSVRIVP